MRVLGEGDAECLVACVADGAGSAKHSDLGSAEACRKILELVTAYHTAHQGLGSLRFEDARDMLRQARDSVVAAAEEHGCSPRDFATTLLVAIVADERSYFFQIGDGAIILGRNQTRGVVFWPQSGEYANTTNFLTGELFEDKLEFIMVEGPIGELALLTDGLERLALVFESQTPHAPFCGPLFAGLQAEADLVRLSADLRDFLDSESVRQRSDDDKSLVLASRIAASEGESPNKTGSDERAG